VDRFTANIAVTYQTVKMVLAGAEESSIEQRCAIAGQLLDALAAIPTAYIANISTPMLHHLASVGHLLGTVIHTPLSQWSFLQVRNVLSALADLLAGLELALSLTSDISIKLKAHVSKIDGYMASAALEAQREQVYHLPRPYQMSDSHERTAQPLDTDQGTSPQKAKTDGDFAIPDLFGDWTFELSPDHRLQLQTDLTTDWPIHVGRNGMPDYFGGSFGSGLDIAPSLGEQGVLDTSSFNSDTTFP
ncbi:MAG: hypothetical protein TREMPRED_003385, partial [Tremellales sp. Tagirdzhanova-0007]